MNPNAAPFAQILERFPALARLAERRRRQRRIPFVRQLTITDCGAACLTMVLNYYGKHVRLDEVRSLFAAGRDGVSTLSILGAADIHGLLARGAKVDLDDLELLEPGTVLHWEFRHFVVFERLRDNGVVVVDPALGRRHVPMEEFSQSFTGVAVLFEPTERFEKQAKKDHLGVAFKRILGTSGMLPRIAMTTLLIQIFALSIPFLTGQLVDHVVPRQDYHLLYVLLIGLGAIMVFNFLATMIRGHLLLHLRTLLDARMTLSFLDHLVALPYSYFQLRPAGDLMMRLNSNTTVRELLTSSALSGMLDGSLVVVYLGILLVASPTMSAWVMAIGLIDITIFTLSRRRQRELAAQTLQIQAKSQDYQVEMLTAMETLKAMGGEGRAVEHWSGLFVDVLNVTLDRGRLAALIDALSASSRAVAPMAILAVGTLQVLHGDMTLGTMLSLNALASSFLVPLSALVATATQLQLLGSYLDRINDVLDTAPEQDRAAVQPAHALTGQITLDRVSFRYSAQAPLAVCDLSLNIEPGQFVAIVGRSGAGKSTLASLLLGLYRPIEGRILYDGVNLLDLDFRSVRQKMGIVTQRHDLFGASIRDNISMMDTSLPFEQIVWAARMAHIHEEIMAMPLSYDTPIVDHGAYFSGGQKQRLALARALVRNPSILLLDEATSALDAFTEAKVQDALASLRCTRIVIAHRLSTILRADRILVLSEGRILESGTHEDLLMKCGMYHELVRAQTVYSDGA